MSARAHNAELGVVVALPGEADSFGMEHPHAGDFEVFDWGMLAIAGLGFERAADAARKLVERGARALLSWGVAGGLANDLVPGDLLLPERVISDGEEWITDRALRARVQQVLGVRARERDTLFCSRVPVTSVEAKRALAGRGMLAVDMESAGVATIARRAGVPFVAVKAICDPVSREIPDMMLHLLDSNGGVRWRAMPGVLRAGPRAWRDLNGLRKDMAAARGSLWRAARVLPRCAQS
ncbi:MAG: phosphorylase family protein [Rhodanobacteraceae bacterium]